LTNGWRRISLRGRRQSLLANKRAEFRAFPQRGKSGETAVWRKWLAVTQGKLSPREENTHLKFANVALIQALEEAGERIKDLERQLKETGRALNGHPVRIADHWHFSNAADADCHRAFVLWPARHQLHCASVQMKTAERSADLIFSFSAI
jgi:hypothetical protein